MAKKSAVEKNAKRARMAKRFAAKRARLREVARDRSLPPEERFQAFVKLAKLPRNASPVRQTNRCAISGRRHGYLRKFNCSRLTFREAALAGLIPGVTKASW